MDRFGMAVLSFGRREWDESRARRTLDRVMEEARKEAAIARLRSRPGCRSASVHPRRVSIALPDAPSCSRCTAIGMAATPSFFLTIGVPSCGTPVRRGDHGGAAPVIVVSDSPHAGSSARATPWDGLWWCVRRRSSRARRRWWSGWRATRMSGRSSRSHAFRVSAAVQRYDPSPTIAARAGDVRRRGRALQRALQRADPDLAVDAIGTGRNAGRPFVFLRARGWRRSRCGDDAAARDGWPVRDPVARCGAPDARDRRPDVVRRERAQIQRMVLRPATGPSSRDCARSAASASPAARSCATIWSRRDHRGSVDAAGGPDPDPGGDQRLLLQAQRAASGGCHGGAPPPITGRALSALFGVGPPAGSTALGSRRPRVRRCTTPGSMAARCRQRPRNRPPEMRRARRSPSVQYRSRASVARR